MTLLAIVGGSGLSRLNGLLAEAPRTVTTAYGEPSAPLTFGHLGGQPVVFLPRHGQTHHLPPHQINYRANIAALRDAGVSGILAINTVGGIASSLVAGALAVPHQLIDYTWGRESSFARPGQVLHVDFSHPYSETLRQRLLQAAQACGVAVQDGGVYAATQGPRLETAAEIDRLERDGCHMVGMTGMPEAALAREAGLDYACLALVANRAAGRSDSLISMADIERTMQQAMPQVHVVLAACLSL